MKLTKIGVIGTGYVGLVTGVCFASKGIEVICMDNSEQKVKQLQAGMCPIYEPGLEDLMKITIESNLLKFTTNIEQVASECDLIFLCLPTPTTDDGSASIKATIAVSTNLSTLISRECIIVNKSTVPVGTTDLIKDIFDNANNKFVEVINNPEFLREGFAVEDFLEPERVVIGCYDNFENEEVVMSLYTNFTSVDKILFMDPRSSEMTKYTANSFLATKISFVNEIANLCEKVGANIDNVVLGVGSDSRIGPKFLKAGIGYGGSCLPKDVKALNSTSTICDYDFQLLQTVLKVNHTQKRHFCSKITKFFEKIKQSNITLAVWGATFKADTDDIRDSAAIEIMQILLESNYIINLYDPKGIPNMKLYYPNFNINYCHSKEETLNNSDALVILTDWKEFKSTDLENLKSKLSIPVIFDGRNIFSIDKMKESGFEYFSVGR